MPPSTVRHFINTPSGVIHIATAGTGFPLLLLHQTPRSWDEFRDVIPILAQHFRVIAMDTIGFGDSARLPQQEHSIERWAAVSFELLDALGIRQAAIAGHHTGAVTALEMAASQPQRVAALILSSCPFNDVARRASHVGQRTIDEVQRSSDGHHLGELWRRRQPYYPAQDIDLLERYIVDAIKAGDMASHGHHVVGNYLMETRIPLVAAPTLVIKASADPHAAPSAARVAAAISGSELIDINDAMVPFPDQLPTQFAAVLADFLARQSLPALMHQFSCTEVHSGVSTPFDRH
jgi:pimeloyl-ACP methyl ester carboxylesterase